MQYRAEERRERPQLLKLEAVWGAPAVEVAQLLNTTNSGHIRHRRLLRCAPAYKRLDCRAIFKGHPDLEL